MITNKMFRWFIVKDNFLDKQTCEELIKYCDVGDSKNTGLSKRYNIDLQHDDMEHELFDIEDKVVIDKVWSLLKTTNDVYYKFKINQMWGNTLLVRKYNPGSTSTIHTDFGTGREIDSLMKLTCVVFLNDDYMGGELEITQLKVPPKTGRAVIFPSFALHGSGEHDNNRYMLLGWAIGDTFV
jgi:hypothetical protein